MSYFDFEQKDESFPERQNPSLPFSGDDPLSQSQERTEQPGAYAPGSYAAAGFHTPGGTPGFFGGAAPGGTAAPEGGTGAAEQDVLSGVTAAASGQGVFQSPASGQRVFQSPAPGDQPYGRSQYAPEQVYTAPAAASGVYGAQPGPVGQNRTQKKKKKAGSLGKGAVALALCCSLLAGAAGAGGVLLLNNRNNASVAAEDSRTRPSTSVMVTGSNGRVEYTSAEAGSLLTAEEVYARNVNSTVGITTEITTTNFFGYKSTSAASGSGFILTEDGYILTNHHVIEGANSITVTTYDGTRYRARLVGSNEANDIAVLKIDASGLQAVKLGRSEDLMVGQDVIAIGNPLGELTFSLTRGVVSALDREITMSNRLTMNLIQTDCAINSGNSGGALFNLYGEVVGITNAKYSTSIFSGQASIDNIGFAIPIDSVLDEVQEIIEKGR